LAVVVIGGLSLAVPAVLCTIVIEPEAEPARLIELPLPSGETAE
jgi:hypothetical protein